MDPDIVRFFCSSPAAPAMPASSERHPGDAAARKKITMIKVEMAFFFCIFANPDFFPEQRAAYPNHLPEESVADKIYFALVKYLMLH
ncbi:hypothetical protein [Methanolacinia petrolearia]|uniref:hypothetical protein n=1 Tax=Methanolacinia petrolearia TaxID=54120 RepID=UPI003BAADF98